MPRATTTLLLSALALLTARASSGAEGPSGVPAEGGCSSSRVVVDPAVQALWPAMDAELRRALAGRRDIDACARVHVKAGDASLAVEVTLPDGRTATRPVRQPEDLLPTVEALVLLPVQATPAQDIAQTPVAPTLLVVSSAPVVSGARPRVAFELSLGVGAHVGDGQSSLGVGVGSLLDVFGWLVGFQAEADRYDGRGTSAAPTGALEAGLLGGRRFRMGDFAIDLLAGPAVTLRGGWRVATVKSQPDGTPSMVVQSSADQTLVPRVRLGGRLTFRAGSTLRTFVGLEGDVGATGPVAPPQLGQAQGLPSWTVGLTVGATVSTS